MLLNCFGLQLNAQDIKDYKYVVVPDRFEFQKEDNQYDLNKLSRFLFRKYGFDAYLSREEMPADSNRGDCNTLYANIDQSGIFSTKVILKLKNCRGTVVYTSKEGRSKIKNFEEGYQEAIRKAFAHFEDLGYTYSDDIVKFVDTAEAHSGNENAVDTTQEIPDKEVVVSAITKVNKDHSPVTIGEMYVSEDGSYTLKKSNSGFDVLDESGSKIGAATRTSTGSYLISTIDFSGVGAFDGKIFFVEREIKGVSGLVKMVFLPIE